MTKLRPPLSVDAALARIAGQLEHGWEEMAAVTSRKVGLIRAWSDPLRRERIPVDDAILLDLAYRRAGGQGAPIFEAYGAKLQAEGLHWFADEVALGRQAAALIKECGDAEAAVVIAAQPGASARDRAKALQEVEEALAMLTRMRLMLSGSHNAPFTVQCPAPEIEPPATGPP